MNLANQITLIRILLIPLFAGFGIYYSHSVQEHSPNETLRYAAIAVFIVASVSDAVDGWIARHFNQRTRLGAILDPLADKLLLVAAVSILSFSAWPVHLPLWFVIILISREVLTIFGAFVIDYTAGKVSIVPHWSGKVSTFTQLATLACSMFELKQLVTPMAIVASVFAFGSGMYYVADAVKQIAAAGQDKQEP